MLFLRLMLYTAAVLSLFIMVSGCDRPAQYAFLTTVFTGVPPMEELYSETDPEDKDKEALLAKEDKVMLRKHPLWAAKECTACHETGADGTVSMVAAEKDDQSQSEPDNDDMVAELVLPADRLCIKCHLDKTARRAIRERLWLHNPVALGDCLACHNEHESRNIAQLRETPEKICVSCHQTDQLPGACNKEMKHGCIGCHNSHMGMNRFLLTSDYKEKKILSSSL